MYPPAIWIFKHRHPFVSEGVVRFQWTASWPPTGQRIKPDPRTDQTKVVMLS